MHLRDRHGLGQRDHEGVRKRRVRDTHMRQLVVDEAQRRQSREARRHLFVTDLGAADLAHHARHRPALAVDLTHAGGAKLAAELLLAAGVKHIVLQIAMQERGMRRVDADLEGLQPVASPQPLEGEAVRGGRGKAVEGRQRGQRQVFGAEVGEDHARHLPHRVAALAHALAQRGADRFGGSLQAAAVGRELPAVEGAADAVALVPCETQIGTAVRAVAVEQTPGTCGIAKQHQILPQQAHRLERATGHAWVEPGVELIDQRRRLPIAAQQLAAAGAGADAGDQIVLCGLHLSQQSRGRHGPPQAAANTWSGRGRQRGWRGLLPGIRRHLGPGQIGGPSAAPTQAKVRVTAPALALATPVAGPSLRRICRPTWWP